MVDSNNDDGTSKPNGSTPATTSSSDLGMIDEEQQVQAQMIDEEQQVQAPTTDDSVHSSVRFAPPQDVQGERMSFSATSSEKQSVKGIIQYGRAPSSMSSETREQMMDRRKSLRGSSLDLRKSIPNSLLLTDSSAIIDDMNGGGGRKSLTKRQSTFNKLKFDNVIHRFFLNPRWSLRRQMLSTFGTVSSLSILLVMIVSIIAAVYTGNDIKDEANVSVEEWVDSFTITTSRLVAEAVSPLIMPIDLVDLMVEVAQDRFMGYPKEGDSPFFDDENKINLYPLQNTPLPFDWDFNHTPNGEGNVNDNNYAEHVQDRWSWYSANPKLSTEQTFYHMQGTCDPQLTNSSAIEYYPNCTDANNNVITGGVLAPNPTNELIYQKAADLSPFLKALYEYHQYIKQLGYYFSNSGAGSSMMLPHYALDGTSEYVSIGCDWMRAPNPINPELGSIASEEEIARCHPEGVVVPTRAYSPLERGWCRDQVLSPNRMHNVGPYVDAWSKERIWLMTAGRAVYDVETGAFISCIAVDFTIDNINSALNEVKVDELGTLTLVRNNDVGTVIWSPNFDFEAAESTTTVDDPLLETGVDQQMFNTFQERVDWSQSWNPEEVANSFETAIIDNEEVIIAGYPIPPVPKTYDPSYLPEMYAIFTLPRAKGLKPLLNGVNDEIDDTVQSIVIFTLIIGIVGIVIVLVLILTVASWFTKPLKWMSSVGDQVVGKFGQEDESGIDYKRKKIGCSPNTELTALETEFSQMIQRFSGEGTAKRVKMNDVEKINVFDFGNEFTKLYQSRNDSSFAFNYPSVSTAQDPKPKSTVTAEDTSKTKQATLPDQYDGKVYKSPFFYWMTGFIVTPVLIVTIIISAVVLSRIANQLPDLISPVEERYFDITESYRSSATAMLAFQASEITSKAVRDTHLLTRLTSWVLFGAIPLVPSFGSVTMLEGAEDCKFAPSEEECDWVTKGNRHCDCSWNDFTVRVMEGACSSLPLSEARRTQTLFFESQSTSTDENGYRNSTNFPNVALYPNTTAWWDNVTVLPGRGEEEMNKTGYDTTYERVRIVSALSTVFIPLYNYDKSDDKPIAMYVGFDADGSLSGYSGCSSNYAGYPHWKSTKENGAAELRPDICPLGKYGYDSRCRGWYHQGEEKAMAGTNASHLHITTPYLFPDKIVGQSVTSPLIDPQTQGHVGQTLVDFLPNSVFTSLGRDNIKLSDGSFAIVITPQPDSKGHDTVYGPGFSLSGEGEAIQDVLQADDTFDSILNQMKFGQRGKGEFIRARSNGGEDEVFLSFAPVYVKNYYPVDSSDITRGVQSEEILVYSLALAETADGLISSFNNIDAFSSRTVDICIGVLSAIIIISAILIVWIAFRVTSSMTKPILQLLGVMKSINSMDRLDSDDTLSKLSEYSGSCKEIDTVYKTTEMLYKVVQFANIAFFSGDLEVAYQVLRDALRLFTRLDNSKAIAVASNNLGNTMLTMYRTMTENEEDKMCGMSKHQVIEKGTAFFSQSIKLGESAYDEFYDKQGWSEECLVFMQFLANRYFNRAIFFLTTSRDHENRKEAESLGFRDLQITGDMDCEIVNQCLESGFRINRVERYELMLSRCRGLLGLVELGYGSDELFLDDQITSVYDDLKTALKTRSTNPLFKDVSVAGRMQKLDVELIRYFHLAKSDDINAARVAIRMLIEDEYIFPDAEEEAIKMLLLYMDTAHDENAPADEDGLIVIELQSLLGTLESDYVKRVSQKKNSFNESTSSLGNLNLRSLNTSAISDKSVDVNESSKASSQRRSTLKQSMKGDFTMELF